jgi:hypothetical protein
MDFTFKTYSKLLKSFIKAGYSFQTFEQFMKAPLSRVVILRHDVDLRPSNSFQTAKIENQLGINSSYYFRIVKESFNPLIIDEIIHLGHEIGYHYETMDTSNGNIDLAYQEFCKVLELFKKIVPVTTVCMHGSPLSKFDNRNIWTKYDYKRLGIIGEPYFDLDFSKILYLTDTGRRWDGNKVNIRDKALNSKESPACSEKYKFHSTQDIVNAINKNGLPDQIMINTHPQRWSNNPIAWTKELIAQNIKNEMKRILLVAKSNKI